MTALRFVFFLTSTVLLSTTGCGSVHHSADVRPDDEVSAPLDVPGHFLVGSLTTSAVSEPDPRGEVCRSPMVDPRDGTRLHLVRSRAPLGDYAVPSGRYGANDRQLLRLECGTGRAVGLVRQ